MSLSLEQLSTIKGVIGSSGYNNSEKKSQIEAIVANELIPHVGGPGPFALE